MHARAFAVSCCHEDSLAGGLVFAASTCHRGIESREGPASSLIAPDCACRDRQNR
jgi:hypothetical protein